MNNHTQTRSASESTILRTPMGPAPRRQWVRSIPAARIQWSKLTVEELLETQGEPAALVALVQQRYRITRARAKEEVVAFLNSCSNWY